MMKTSILQVSAFVHDDPHRPRDQTHIPVIVLSPARVSKQTVSMKWQSV